MQNDRSNTRTGKRPFTKGSARTFKVNIDGHMLSLTPDQILSDKSGWTPCHGEVGDIKVRSLSIKRMGDKIMVKNGHGKLAGCYDANEFAVMAKKFMFSIDSGSISIDTKA